jgi:spore coat protein U-like protein
MHRLHRLIIALCVVVPLFGGWDARAQASCSSLQCSCTVDSPSLNFGLYDAIGSNPSSSVGTITVTCSLDAAATASAQVAYGIKLGTGNSTSYAARSMAGSSGDHLIYNIYTQSGYTTVWGDGTGASSSMAGTFTLAPGQQATSPQHAYGYIPGGQRVRAGTYADTIVITIEY